MLLSRKNIPKTQRHEATYSGFISSPDNKFIGQDVKFQIICDCKEKYAYRNKGSCPNCGAQLDDMKNPKYLSYTYYYNVSKKKSGDKYKSISDIKVNKIVSDFFIENLQFSPELVEWSKKYICEMKDKEIQDKIVITQRKSERIVELQNKKAKLRSMYQEGKFSDEEYKEDLARLEISYKDTSATFANSDWYSRLTEIINITEEISKVLLSDNIQL